MFVFVFVFGDFGLSDDFVDDFEDTSGWTAMGAPGVTVALTSDTGHTGAAMRIDFDFHGPGGYVIVDDYQSWRSCRKAVTDFRAEQGIDAEIKLIGRDGAYWQVTPR